MGSTTRRKRALFFFLYFFEGAPIGLIWWTIPTVLSTHGVGVDVITTMTASATFPWTFKFVFGPVVDRFLIRQRSFAISVATLQSGMLLGLAGLIVVPFESSALLWVILVISFFSALQDVVIDAWAIATVEPDERGHVNGAMQAGMLSGRWVFGAGLLIGLAYVDWQLAVGCLCGFVALCIAFLLVRFGRDQRHIAPETPPLGFGSLSFVKERRFLLLAAIALLTGFAYKALGSVVGPFLIDNGFQDGHVGYVLSGTLVMMLLGALFGGALSDKHGSHRLFALSCLLLAIAVSAAGLVSAGGLPVLIACAVLVVYFLIGIFTASSYAFFMNQAEGAMEATKFTFLMAITNLCESAATYVTGQIAAGPLGYGGAFLVCAGISLLGLVLLRKTFQKQFPVA